MAVAGVANFEIVENQAAILDDLLRLLLRPAEFLAAGQLRAIRRQAVLPPGSFARASSSFGNGVPRRSETLTSSCKRVRCRTSRCN
jgi:hypothetical protein